MRFTLQAITFGAGLAAIWLNATKLRTSFRTPSTSRRITWLLVATGALVILTVLADLLGLRAAYAFA